MGGAAGMIGPAWQAAHIGFDHDGVLIAGLDIWALEWRAEDAPPARLAHPAHPGQFHDFALYRVTKGDRVLRFAAAELSNGVWGFYTREADMHEDGEDDGYHHGQTAPDGSIRVDFEEVEWRMSQYVVSPRVTETATGRVLLDLWGTDWDAAARFPDPRSVHLLLRRFQAGGACAVDIRLDGERYIISAPTEARGEGPIADILPAIEAAAASSMDLVPPHRARGLGKALPILAGALIAIAGIAFVAWSQSAGTPQTRNAIPQMPS